MRLPLRLHFLLVAGTLHGALAFPSSGQAPAYALPPGALPVAGSGRVTPIVEVVRAVGPAVVNIHQQVVAEQPLPWPYNQIFPSRRMSTSLGSGVLVDQEGYIVTNAHVIQPSGTIQVQLADGSTYPALLVNIDATNDVALLKIHADAPLPVAPLGTSSDLMVGETVVAIGNPLGNASSVTAGIVSSLFRDVRVPGDAGERFRDFIQLDAAINPGNSGGPLLNVDGEVVGITWAIARDAEGIGFAIPIDRVRRSLLTTLLSPQLHNNVVTGLEFSPPARGKGVAVGQVLPDSPAERAGLRAGDEVVSIDGAPIAWEFDVAKMLCRAEPGDDVGFVVRRSGRLVPVELRLEARESPLQFISQALGVRVVDHPSYFGVLVESVDPGGPAARLPLRRGDLIDGVDGRPVDGLHELHAALREVEAGRRVILSLFRGGHALRAQVHLAPR